MAFDHDAQGNTVRKIVRGNKEEQPTTLSLRYDAENRLVKAVKPQADRTSKRNTATTLSAGASPRS